jgi:hypothetical protein
MNATYTRGFDPVKRNVEGRAKEEELDSDL